MLFLAGAIFCSVLFGRKKKHASAIGVLYCIRNSHMIRLDMALKRKIGLENLQKFDYDQITLVRTHKKAPMIMKHENI